MAEMFSNAASYDKYMGRWSARLAPLFLEFAGIHDGTRVLDVGCGTGSLVQAVANLTERSEIVGVDPAAGFIAYARQRFTDPRITFDHGSALDLPYPESAFDQSLSMLVLMLIPTPAKAASEMRRVTKPGGNVAACTWDGAGGMELTNIFWSEAVRLDPAAENRGERARHCNLKGHLSDLWKATGLDDVEETAIDIQMEFNSFDDYWLPMLHRVGPTGVYIAALSDESRNALREALRRRLLDGRLDGPFVLHARSWAVRGAVPK
jgi:SAM-dependent methyltransferase